MMYTWQEFRNSSARNAPRRQYYSTKSIMRHLGEVLNKVRKRASSSGCRAATAAPSRGKNRLRSRIDLTELVDGSRNRKMPFLRLPRSVSGADLENH